MSKKILIIVSNTKVIGPKNRKTGVFLPEAAHPYGEFDAVGYEIDFASITGEVPALDGMDGKDEPENAKFLQGAGWEKMQNNHKLADLDVSVYDAIFVAGGLAPMVDLAENPLLKKVIAETYERGAVVGAVCHGPVALLNVKLSDGTFLVKDKDITSFTNEEVRNTLSPTCFNFSSRGKVIAPFQVAVGRSPAYNQLFIHPISTFLSPVLKKVTPA